MSTVFRALGASALALLVACSGGTDTERAAANASSEAAGPEDAPWGEARETQARKYRVAVAFDPEPPVMGELFSARATVTTREGEPVDDATVIVDATMPHHGHGMETAPVARPGECDDEGTCRHPGGVYVSDGFKFHMGGAWTVTVQVDGPRGPDNTSFVYEMR